MNAEQEQRARTEGEKCSSDGCPQCGEVGKAMPAAGWYECPDHGRYTPDPETDDAGVEYPEMDDELAYKARLRNLAIEAESALAQLDPADPRAKDCHPSIERLIEAVLKGHDD